MTLRPYQSRLKSDIYDALRQHRTVMAQLPTGGGKTVIFADIVNDVYQKGKSVGILVHRQELVEQTAKTLRVPCSVIAAGLDPDPTSRVDIAMVQTLARRNVPAWDVLIIDEAHRSAAKTYCDIIGQHAGKIIGFTATPERLDGRGFTDLYEDLVCGPTIGELVRMGHLVPAKVFVAPVQKELRNIRTTAGDYNQKDLAEFMAKSRIYGQVVGSYRKHCDGAKCITFAASVELAESYAQEYSNAGVAAAVVSGKTPYAERVQIMHQFRRGLIQVLVNVAIATEGLDVPDCDAVQLLRPTQSLSLYMQMVGRALRPAPNKTHAVILDHAGCTLQHGPVEHPRMWTLEGRKARMREELPPLVKVPTPLDDEPNKRSGPEHDESAELEYLPPVYLDPLPVALRMALESSHTPLDAWALYTESNKPEKAVAEVFARLHGLPRRWVYEAMVSGVFA
jgi:DNA repair protein RadD